MGDEADDIERMSVYWLLKCNEAEDNSRNRQRDCGSAPVVGQTTAGIDTNLANLLKSIFFQNWYIVMMQTCQDLII